MFFRFMDEKWPSIIDEVSYSPYLARSLGGISCASTFKFLVKKSIESGGSAFFIHAERGDIPSEYDPDFCLETQLGLSLLEVKIVYGNLCHVMKPGGLEIENPKFSHKGELLNSTHLFGINSRSIRGRKHIFPNMEFINKYMLSLCNGEWKGQIYLN